MFDLVLYEYMEDIDYYQYCLCWDSYIVQLNEIVYKCYILNHKDNNYMAEIDLSRDKSPVTARIMEPKTQYLCIYGNVVLKQAIYL